MEFNQENIESVVQAVGLKIEGLNKTMETMQKYTEQIKPIVEEAIRNNPDASHDEIVEIAAEMFNARQEELIAQQEGKNVENDVNEQDTEKEEKNEDDERN